MDVQSGRPEPISGNNFMITLDTENEDETSRLFETLSNGGFVTIALERQFWGRLFWNADG